MTRGRRRAFRGLCGVIAVIGLVSSWAFVTKANASAPLPSVSRSYIVKSMAGQIPEIRMGDVVHVTRRFYQRRPPDIAVGPPHLTRADIASDTLQIETWAVADERGAIAHAVTYTRDDANALLRVAVVESGIHLRAWDVRTGEVTTGQFAQASQINDVGGLTGVLREAQALTERTRAGLKEEIQEGAEVTTIEYRSLPGLTSSPGAMDDLLSVPYASDLPIQSVIRRLTFANSSRRLLTVADLGVTEKGEEHLLRSQEWLGVEVFSASTVPAATLNPDLPSMEQGFSPVARKHISPKEAATTLPFNFYRFDPSRKNFPEPSVTYAAGSPLDFSQVPLRFRDLNFASARGEAANSVYDQTGSRYLGIVQGPSARFDASLRGAKAFWAGAEAITVTVDGTKVSGWFLTSAPVKVTDDPRSGVTREVAGLAYILLPDVGGTGVLIVSQDYGREELVTIAGYLQRAR